MAHYYLKQEGFSGKVAIVDIGWFGNMQVALEEAAGLAGIKADVVGYYVGLGPLGENQLHHAMRGYLRSNKGGEDRWASKNNFILVFELSSQHPTARL